MKKLGLSALLLFCTLLAFSQDEEEMQNKVFAGGNFALSFGTYTFVNINPQIGYRFNRFLSAGLGMNFLYTSQKERYNGIDYSKTTRGVAGMNTFVRFYPVQKFFAQIQPEANYIFGNTEYYLDINNQPLSTPVKYKLDAEIIPSLLAGGGLATPAGR
ncbi:MAG TPA: hypothetical protein VFL47_07280, partial [Flavisolibacter sp.]|nr:hypothetical protein [Flavisolibacter sp.]